MKEGPDISELGALIGVPGRANMLLALMDGRALTAGELAGEAGVSLQTASGHLARLLDGGLLEVGQQGRHRYFRLAGEDVADALSALLALSETRGRKRLRTGPRDADLRLARSCYHHLAGELGVQLYDSLRAKGWIHLDGDGIGLSREGAEALTAMGIDLSQAKGPLCRECLDWSERRMHLAGPLGKAVLTFVLTKGWAVRDPDSRAIRFSAQGRRAFDAAFPVAEGVLAGE
ncbi:ArsR/SmtB family transcription factor [Pseudooceanicola sp. MF1-13]|uniref:ArsR/SmtB family transcription factor n=1 Tax=Pseudooceanicola sp. MF1-13 TaxID=3379095 RepID=UPI003891820A